MVKNIFLFSFVGVSVSLLSGCATIVNGRYQNIAVATKPPGALCAMHNNKGAWHIKKTPAKVKVHRSADPLHISCHKSGYKTATKIVYSHAKKMMAGNLIAGGIVGIGIDAADGAGFSYPNKVRLDLSPYHSLAKKARSQK